MSTSNMNENSIFGRMNFTKRLLTIPMMFILSLVAIIALNALALKSQDGIGVAVNVAGRQRMLNQRHAKELMLETIHIEQSIESTRKLMMESATALRDGGAVTMGARTVQIAPAPTAALKELFDEQKRLLSTSFQLAEDLMKLDDSSDSEVAVHSLGQLFPPTRKLFENFINLMFCDIRPSDITMV